MSDRLEDATPQEPAEATPESAVEETGDSETSASDDPQDESTVAAAAESEPVVEVDAEAVSEAEVTAATEDAEPEAATEDAGAAVVSEDAEPKAAAEVAEPEAAADEAEPEAAADEAEPEAAADEAEPEAAAEVAEPEAEAGPEAAVAADDAEGKVEASGGEGEASSASDEAGDGEAKADSNEGIPDLEEALAQKQAVKGQVIGWNKGGYHVAIGKIAAFCPVSQIEIGNPRSPKRYLDKTFSFRIIEIQNGGRRVVLSRAAAIKDEREQKAALVRELLQPGVELEGKISSLTSFGAFVDLGGGIEGLVHVSEISRRRVEHPKEVLKSAQKVRVTVLKIEKGGQRISLSMKRLEPDPWKGVAERFPEGSQFTGKVLRQTDFGVFVEVEPGLEGLVHTSRLALGMNLSDESLEVGKEVAGWIHEVEAKRRRLSLSLREVAGGNPWKGIHDRYPVGDVTKGTVERLASFGVFIMLEPGLTGLLPFSVLGTTAGNPRRQYHVGKEVSVRVLSIDRDKRRISLGTESSKAEGNEQDYREYVKAERKTSTSSSGLNAMAAAFAKLKEQKQA